MTKESNNEILDIGINYIKSDKFNIKFQDDKLSPEEIEKQKLDYLKYLKSLKYEKLNKISNRLNDFNDKDFDLKNPKNNDEVCSFISDISKDLNINIKIDNNVVDDNEYILSQINDPEFKSYYDIRKSLKSLKNKIISNKINVSYFIPNVDIILEKLDIFIYNYIIRILIMSNKENITKFIKKNYPKK